MNIDCTRHFPDDLLERYAMGKLSDQESAPIEEHLLVCSACQQRLEQADEFLAVTKTAMTILTDRNVPSQPIPIHKSTKSSAYLRFAWAVGLAAALAIFSAPLFHGNGPAVTLTSQRGAAEFPRVHTARSVTLRIDVTQISQPDGYQLEVVTHDGEPVWHAAVEPRSGQIETTVEKRLAPGRYWIRLYDTGGPWNLLREYGLEVEN